MNILKRTNRIFRSFVIIVFSLVLISCKEDAPTKVWNENSGGAAPKINSVEPTDSVFSYSTVIKITGENFSASIDAINGNKVYFNNKLGTVVSASATEINVLSPDVSGDSLTIKIFTPKSAPIAEFSPMKIYPTVDKVEQFNPLESVTAIEVDAEGNLYGFVTDSLSGIIYKISSDGSKNQFGTALFPSASDMKFGPGGYLYVQQSGSRNIHRVDPDGGAALIFVTLPNSSDGMRYYDFDENQNLFTSGNKKGVFAVSHQSGTARRVSEDYVSHDVKSLRVYNGYIYITAVYSGTNTSFPAEGIWRSQITSAAGDLGPAEVVFDFETAGIEIGSLPRIPITFAENGDMFVGCDNDNSIVIIHPDLNFESLYPGYIEPTSLQLIWGNSKFMYQNRISDDVSVRGIYKIYTNRFGAPYYGRQ